MAFQALETDDDEYDGLAPAPRHNHLRLVGVAGPASETADRPNTPPGPPGARRLLNWLRHYLNTTGDADLVPVPWIDFRDQPACTVGRQLAMKDLKSKMLGPETTPSPGTITPARWTRMELARWAGVLGGEPQPVPGLNSPGDAMKILAHYRGLVENTPPARQRPTTERRLDTL